MEFLASSKRLRELVFPESVVVSPYEVLGYNATLTLHDHKGLKATYSREQRVRFLQDGVAAILDHLWGDGLTTEYSNTAGKIGDSIRDEGRRHLVIALNRPMARGQELSFVAKRTTMVGFTKEEEWVQTVVDHPVSSLRRSVIFPKARPCRQAVLVYDGNQFCLPIVMLPDGKSKVAFQLDHAKANTAYTVRWRW